MRLLVVTPLYHQWQASLDSILALEKPCAVDYLMLANDDPYADGTLAGNYQNITHKYNHARDIFLAGDYDALVCIEDDIIVPPDALKRLTAVGADIVYGLTCWRHGTPVWSARVADGGPKMTDGGWVPDGLSLGRVLSETPEDARASWGKVIDVVGVGQACTLIQRRVMEAQEFRLDYDKPVCCDWWLARDAWKAGFSQKADLGLITGHITRRAWATETGAPAVLWPTNEGRLWWMEAL